MVVGMDLFKAHFKGYEDHFVATTHLKVKLSQGELEIFCDNSKIL